MSRGDGYVLVTGSSGLVGSEICKLLEKNRKKFIAVDRAQPLQAVNWKTKIVDLKHEVGAELPEIDTVFHCAARIPVAVDQFQECADLNRKIDEVVAKFIAECGVKKLVFASTTNLYGTSNDPISEQSELHIDNAYAAGKLESERTFASIESASTFLLRLNAPYGPWQRHRTVLSTFIERTCAGQDIEFHGSGSRCQDFTHAADVASAFVKCIQSDSKGGTFNISSGTPISMKSLAELIVSLVPDSTSEIRPSNQPDPQEHQRAIFDVSKARNELGWSPRISLRDGISDWIANRS